MKRRTLITTAIVGALSLGLLTATPVLAEGPGYGGGRGAMMFDRLDTNDDGTVTRREFQGSQHARFKQMDLNRDGRVTQHEARKATRQIRDQRWDKGDQDNRHARFERKDLNRDGKVTRYEARKAARQIRDHRWDKGDQNNRHARFERKDLNRDGTVTRYEARKATRQIRDHRRDWNRGGQGNGRGMGFAQDHNRK
jgi:Ca2+-binding EF-hand superfamily protein